MGDTAASIVSLLCGKLPFMTSAAYEQSISRVLNSKKVSDHHAIIPTMELAKTDLTTLPESERNILILTGARLLMATAEPHVYEAVTAVFSCADHDFTARGRTVIAAGWKDMERLYRATLKKKPDSDDENELVLDVPDFSEGQTFENPAAKVTEHDTTPPKPHNEASLACNVFSDFDKIHPSHLLLILIVLYLRRKAYPSKVEYDFLSRVFQIK